MNDLFSLRTARDVKKARPDPGLVFLVLCTRVSTIRVSGGKDPVSAFLSSPHSSPAPLPARPTAEPTALSPSSAPAERKGEETGLATPSLQQERVPSASWRFPLGAGLIALGAILVIAGLFWLIRGDRVAR